MIGRREFIALLSGAVAWPLCVRAQQAKPPTIGYLGATTAAAERSRTDAFVQRLGELGWIDGHTIAIKYRWERAEPNASLRSPPTLSSSGSISLSSRQPQQPSRVSRRHRSSRSCSHSRAIRLAPVWLPA